MEEGNVARDCFQFVGGLSSHEKYIVKTPRLRSKNLVFKNLLGLNLSVRTPLYMKRFSLKFETGFCFLKSIKNVYNYANKVSQH